MGLLSFIKEAGEKLFGGATAYAADAQEHADLNAARAIKTYIETQKLRLENLEVTYVSATGVVTLAGSAISQEDSDRAALAAGNVSGVAQVENNLVAPESDPGKYHEVVRGDTLSAISRKYYGVADKYDAIFEANRPMLSHPDKIYPGQKLRIPRLELVKPGRVSAVRIELEKRAIDSILRGAEWHTAAEIDQRTQAKAANLDATVQRWQHSGEIFGIDHGGRTIYPSYAFDSAGQPLPAVKKILEIMNGRSSLMVASWFESINSSLNGKRPREVIARDPEAVVAAAEDHLVGAVHG